MNSTSKRCGQKVDILYSNGFSNEFCEKWKALLRELYNYKIEDDFVVVPSLFGKNTFSYLPILNYTDKTSHEDWDEIIQKKFKNRQYQIRVLNPDCKTFEENDTVTMRMDLRKGDIEEIWKESLNAKARNQVRKAEKSNLNVEVGNEEKHIKDFYSIFKKTMNYYGTPVFGYGLFDLFVKFFDAKYYNVYIDDSIIAGLVLLYDKDISWVPLAGSDRTYLKYCPNHIIYWPAIKDSFEDKKKIFDFGRSPYGNNTFKFKSQWGAVPVRIDIITPDNGDVYQKYDLAAKVWKKIPSGITDRIGPKICKYLADL